MPARPRTNTRGRTITDPIADDFNRASLGANWASHLGNASIVSNAHWGPSAFSGIHVTSWDGSTLPAADQFAEATVASGVDAQMQYQVYVRRRSSDTARYGWHYNFEASPSPQWEIKYDGVAAELVRVLDTDPASAPAAGSRMRIEVRGTGASITINGYHNGILICSVEEIHADRITVNGPPGLVSRAFVGQTLTYPSPVWTDFAAGTLI